LVISASRRTDIPAFYADWFIRRIEAGYCTVPNPYNRSQVNRISLEPNDVDAIVFWTRHPRPMFPSLLKLEESGYRFYFMISILGYPRQFEPHGPDLNQSILDFQELSGRIGPDRVIWRYDPVILSPATDGQYHLEHFHEIAESLQGATKRVVISIVDIYRKNNKRMALLEDEFRPVQSETEVKAQICRLMPQLVSVASSVGMEIQSCAEEIDLDTFGIKTGKCIDDRLLNEIFASDVPVHKDPGQRPLCGCIPSKDIGMYNSCPFGCRYCYATGLPVTAKRNFQAHNPDSPSLLGWYE